MRFPVLDRSDAEGLAREPGDVVVLRAPRTTRPALVPVPAGRARAGGAVAEVLAGVLLGQEAGADQLLTLFSARGPEVAAVAEVADELRARTVGDTVTWVANRNINYTNVCTFKCRFCAFSKGPLSLNLRGTPYLLEVDEITRRVVEAEALGATEVCLQGGIHPSFDGDYYLDVIKAVRAGSSDDPHSRIHRPGGDRRGPPAERAARVLSPAPDGRRFEDPARDRGRDPRRRDHGRCCARTRSTPSSGWRLIAPPTASACARTSRSCSAPSSSPCTGSATFSAPGICRRRPGGFTEFVPLPFVHMATPIYLQRKSRRGPTFREALLIHAVGRIAYHGLIDNIQVSWVKMGAAGATQVLQAGANDLGGTLMDENISRAAGASHGQAMDEAGFRSLVDPLGRRLEQRTTLYGRVAVAG